MRCTQDLYKKEALDFKKKSNKKKYWQRNQTKSSYDVKLCEEI